MVDDIHNIKENDVSCGKSVKWAARRRAMIDTLLTNKTMTAAIKESKKRMKDKNK